MPACTGDDCLMDEQVNCHFVSFAEGHQMLLQAAISESCVAVMRFQPMMGVHKF